MKSPVLNNKGLLPLGLIMALSMTLSGFEYMNSDIKREHKITSKLESLEDEIIYEDIKLEKPEVPKPEPPKPTPPTVKPTPPAPPVGPIVVSPDPVDPNQKVITDPPVTIIPIFKRDSFIYDPPTVDVGLLQDFPTYREFKDIKDKEEKRSKTETKIITNVMGKSYYPEIPQQLGIQGTVYVSFIVDVDGLIKDVKVVRSIHPDLDAVAVNAVKKLPPMIPGKQYDRPVKVRYNIPVKFTLK